MKRINSPNQTDIVMLYKDRDSVEPAIQLIKELDVEFKAYQFNQKKLNDIAAMKPKVVLLSSNSIKNTIQKYIEYLEKYEQKLSAHSAILLISNREMPCAYLACENGLFDNYAIINPLNDPFRLKLILLQELKIVENHENNGLKQLICDGENELASCIEHGVALKNAFSQNIKKCEADFLSATDKVIENDEVKALLHNLIGVSIEDLNENVTANIEGIVEQLAELKVNTQSIKQNIEHSEKPTKKTAAGVNTNFLSSADDNNQSQHQTLSYKILIAEPSDLFSKVIEEIFVETAFNYLLVHDGKSALGQIDTFKPDIVLLAYDLPTITGLDITRIIREQGNKVPIIAYTHQRDKSMIKRWIPLGLSDYIIKPSKKSTILNSVAKAVKNPIEIVHHQKHADKVNIQWIPEYSVGNKKMDEQHKLLFNIINDFFHKDDKQGAIEIFHDISSYINVHFEAEENLLKQINYPYSEEHIKKHNELRHKFHAIQARLNDYDIDDHHKIAMFLYNWLAKHILKADMEYKTYALSIK